MNALDVAAERDTRAASHRAGPASAGGRQLVALLGQGVAGAGNLAVSVLLARVLLPGEYAGFTAFLGAYVLLHMLATSITAATALDPALGTRLFRQALAIGLVGGTALALGATTLGPMVGLPAASVVLLGASVPSAALLGLARGRLYGMRRVGGIALTLAVEPLARGVIGLLLVPVVGEVGAAAGVVAAGYAALLVAALAGRRPPALTAPQPAAGRAATVTGAFLLVAIIAAQDVIVANKVLPDADAGLVAVVATVGGAAYFATATIPLVLLPSGPGERGSTGMALTAALLVSAAVIAAVALLPEDYYALALGETYRHLADLAVPYVSAMAALGIAKVLLARLCMTGRSRLAALLAAMAVLAQLALLLVATTPEDIVTATVAGCGVLLLGAGAGALRQRGQAPSPEPVTEPIPEARRQGVRGWLRTGWPLVLAVVVGAALRGIVTRSIWLDEAISIRQAQLPMREMLADLQDNDVHPPGFDVVLWAFVHGTGSTAEWVVRMPSLLAGVVLIPVFYAMAHDLWDRRTARIAAFVIAVAPIGVWYAQEARMYALWMLTATLAVWMQLRILRDATRGGRGGWLSWLVFTVATVATVYLQWFAVLPLLVQHAVFLVAAVRRGTRRLWLPWLGAVLLGLALVAPLVGFAMAQLNSVVEAGAGSTPGQTGADVSQAMDAGHPDVYAVLANAIWALWGYHADSVMIQLSALWPFVMVGSLALLGRGRSRNAAVMVLVALVPVAILFAVGFERRQMFELRYFTATVPVLLLLLARLASSWGRGPVTAAVLPVLVVGSLAVGLVDQQVNQSNPRTYDFRGGVQWVEDRAEDGDVVAYAPAFLDDELDYYSPGTPTRPTTALDPDQPRLGLPRSTPRDASVFVFGSFLEEKGTSAEIGRALSDLETKGWKQVGEHEVANVKVWQFQRKESAS
ncbi:MULTISPECIES: glycosyltransferase family 39 protein [unclassified Nocardioides]|uniref:glycosyltransferase family 39 protein n=1 Tax=unclassified Nocardioides TaxID=2615069 RepID=UPI00362413D6